MGVVEEITSQLTNYENGALDEEETVALFQTLVNNGMAWSLQGHYGRTARGFIDAGPVHLRASEQNPNRQDGLPA